MISMLLHHPDQAINRLVHLAVFRSSGFKYILHLHRVSKFIISKKITVAIVDISSGRAQIPCLFRHQDKLLQISFAVHNLKLKAAMDQNSAKPQNHHHQNSCPARYEIEKLPSQNFKQNAVPSFFHAF